MKPFVLARGFNNYMKVLIIIGLLALTSFGVFLVVFGEGDDSPGAQGLGLIIALASLWGVVRSIKNKK
jgi:hypothetical protein